MDLNKLFQMQKELDNHIMDQHPELKEQDNLQWKVLALLVELGECANEWRGFKKWSSDQEPRTKGKCGWCEGKGLIPISLEEDDFDVCFDCEGTGDDVHKNPLLEEYVDCLHFILSIGLEMKVEKVEIAVAKADNITEQFNGLYSAASLLAFGFKHNYDFVFSHFIGLGEMLGFSWEDIEQAYFAKNAVNHQRQEESY